MKVIEVELSKDIDQNLISMWSDGDEYNLVVGVFSSMEKVDEAVEMLVNNYFERMDADGEELTDEEKKSAREFIEECVRCYEYELDVPEMLFFNE